MKAGAAPNPVFPWRTGLGIFVTFLFVLSFLTVGADPAAAASRQGAERAIRECANRNRRAAGLEPLAPSRVLAKAARLQAQDMVRHRFFDHTDQQGRGPAERVEIFDRQHRYTFVGENIAAGYSSALTACEGWMHSPGHRENILGRDYTAIGAGFSRGGEYGRYYVQVFAKETVVKTP